MGVLGAALLANAIVLFGTVFLLCRSLRFAARRRAILYVLAALGSVALVPVTTEILWEETRASGHAEDGSQVHLLGSGLPAAARNVLYWKDYNNARATFIMSERDFRDWAQTKGWKLREESDDKGLRELSYYEMLAPNGRSITVTLDVRTGIGHYRFTAR